MQANTRRQRVESKITTAEERRKNPIEENRDEKNESQTNGVEPVTNEAT